MRKIIGVWRLNNVIEMVRTFRGVYLPDKHLYSTSCLNYVLGITEKYNANDVVAKKCFVDMIKWYIQVRNTFLGLMSKLFKVEKRQKQ